jgi:predicted ribosome quality control (RQC) complex YloA/Tae2 family protein
VLRHVELRRVVAQLGRRLRGHVIQEIVQPDAESLVLGTWGHDAGGRGHRSCLLITCHAQTARVSLLDALPRALPKPPPFTQFLRAHVKGAALRDFTVDADDRIARLALATGEGLRTLVFSIMGRRTNLYLLDADERLLATLRPLDATRAELAVGEPWRPPGSVAPTGGEDRFADVEDEALPAAIEARFGRADAEDAAASLHRRIDQALRKDERRLSRKLEKLEREIEAAREATELGRHGELLKTALGRVERGASAIEVDDPESGERVRIALDPSKSPSENLERLFKRYQKAVRQLTKGGAQEDSVRASHDEIAALRRDFEAAGGDEAALRAFTERPDVATILKRYEGPAPSTTGRARRQDAAEVKLGKQTVPRRLAPRRYRTAGDLEIWVGRSDAANDYLSTRLARGKDLFFHLDGAPGSHVILRTEGRTDPPSDAVLEACELAVHFSKFKNASRADVHVVPIKNVKKPKGAKPGLVHVHGGKSIHLRRDEARLKRILDARIED